MVYDFLTPKEGLQIGHYFVQIVLGLKNYHHHLKLHVIQLTANETCLFSFRMLQGRASLQCIFLELNPWKAKKEKLNFCHVCVFGKFL